MMKYILCTAVFLLINFFSFSQLDDVKIETRNGQKVYVHIVQKGNTLWGLHKLYDVPVEQIVATNPEVTSGLVEGQKVYVPVPIVTDEKKHVVEAGEGLFAVARKYNVTVDELKNWNPGLEDNIKVGQVIKILNSTYITGEKVQHQETVVEPIIERATPIKISFNDSIVQHVVAPGETMYSISKRYIVPAEKIAQFNGKKNFNIKPGEVIRIPLKKEKIEKVPMREVPAIEQTTKKVDPTLIFKPKNSYNVAIMLPFNLNNGTNKSSSLMATEFLMGAQMALDSLEQMGLNAKVHVFDTENSADKIIALLAKPEMKNMDLIIGPLNKVHAQTIADWCLKNKVRLVVPVNVDTKILQNNPFVYTTMASDITLMKGMAKYVANQFKGGKVVLVKPTNPQDSSLYQAFRMEYNRIAGNGGTKLIETTAANIGSYTSTTVKTAIIFPTTEQKSANSLINELVKLGTKVGKSTYVFGTDNWSDWDGISASNKTKFHLSVPTTMDLNYSYERTKVQHRKYRRLYKSDFTKVAIQGYDVTFSYLAELLLNKKVGQVIMNNFKSVQIGPNHGFENQNTEILMYDNYNLLNISNGLE